MKSLNIFCLLTCLLTILGSCNKINPNVNVVDGFEHGTVKNGIFSISPSAKVQFSQGNLQFRSSSQTWRFASSQYEQFSIGNYDEVHNDWIDLFIYSSTKTNYGTRIATDITSWNDYVSNSSEFVDWGTLNISNSSYRDWRTLSKDEWLYLIHKREHADEKFIHATVNGVEGHILLPDEWNYPDNIKFEFTYDKPGLNNYNTNKYNSEQWKKLQLNGAVFLPCKDDASRNGFNNCYWTSTIVSSGKRPCFIGFYPFQGRGSKDGYFNTIEMCSVRLVRDVK